MKSWFTKNIPLKIIALLLALVLHLFLRGDREEVQAVFVPVSASLPDNRILLSEPVSRLKVTIRGKRSTLDRLGEKGMTPINIDLQDAKDGSIEFTPDLLRLPTGITVQSIQPPSMRVILDRKAKKKVQVLARLIGSVAPGYRVTQRRVEPPEVTVAGPSSVVREMTAVVTDQIELTGRTKTFTTSASVRDISSQNAVFAPQTVDVTVEIEPILIQRDFIDVPIEVRGELPYETTIEPKILAIRLAGPIVSLNEMEPTDIVAVVDLRGQADREPGTFQLPVNLEGLGSDFTVLKIDPDKATVTTEPRVIGPDIEEGSEPDDEEKEAPR